MGKKIFKKLAFMGLAVCMGALTLLGTACTPTQGSQSPQILTTSEMTTETAGLIYPKAEDPTLYTTESGIEIKFGLSSLDIESSLLTGNLKGFPYFTTSDGTTTYTWVIIGQAEDKPLGTGKPASFLFSNWTSLSEYYINKNYFSNNILDTTTPAGSAINSVTPSKSYVIDRTNFGNITTSKEIPSGCVLVLANDIVGTGTYNNGAVYIWNNEYCAIYERGINIATTMHGYYSNKSYGLSSIYTQIQEVPLATKFSRCYQGVYYYYDIDNSSENLYVSDTPKYSNHYIFPLAANADSTFYYEDYITLTQMSCSSAQFLRGSHTTTYNNTASGYNNDRTTILDANASSLSLSYVRSTCGYRPAFVLEI